MLLLTYDIFFLLDRSNPQSRGNLFHIGFMRNNRDTGARSNLQVLVSTDDPSPVSFTVTTFSGGTTTTTHTATHGSITKVDLSAETFQVLSTRPAERNKHIIVQAEPGKSISVYGVNDEDTTTDAFLLSLVME